jgi:hypothetical protein
MIRTIICLSLLVFISACGQKPSDQQPTKTQTAKDPKLVKFEENIAKTTPEGKDFIEKAKVMKPEVNGQVSTKTLAELVDNFSKNMGDFNIKPIGWEASEKKTSKTWKLVFYYQDYTNQYQAAEWQYDPETKKLYPFDLINAPVFYTGEGGEGNSNTKPKK